MYEDLFFLIPKHCHALPAKSTGAFCRFSKDRLNEKKTLAKSQLLDFDLHKNGSVYHLLIFWSTCPSQPSQLSRLK